MEGEEGAHVDPFHAHLRTHKLQGKLKGFWACSVDIKHRIIFRFDKNAIILEAMGPHDIYDRFG